MKITLRTVHCDDAPFLTRLMNEKVNLISLNECPTRLEDWQEAITAWSKDPDEEDYIVLLGGEPIGWAGVNELSGEIPYLKMFVLLPEQQHQGIGPQALGKLLANLRAEGFPGIRLFTNLQNKAGRRCYEKCGFVQTDTFVEQMSDGSLQERCRMELMF